MKKIPSISTIVSTLAPSLVFAQGGLDTIEQNIITPLDSIISALIPIVVGLLVISFFWGMAKYVFAQGDEAAKASGKKIMIYGAIAMFIAFSIWGIILTLQETFGVSGGASDVTTDLVPVIN